ncbi:hypothetical protein BS47DRAFT_1400446 [Hydnum rufescens UP504]|uniref:Uncharacterized protein n=1 Tax=Hydnum rufescens UP504 TaxID=1448309 RepID=A0A9P6AIA0_9AGAM|nr:hypothetical protein BS47DRAFT_1400446 [Hydnum rufescens UP504]
MSQSADSLRVHLRELTDELAGLVTDTGTVALEDELQLKITEIRASVQHLESNIAKKTEELHLSDQKSHKELEWLKTNKWINLQLNIRVVRDQLLMKLRACKFELVGLEHADTSRQLDHKTKEHVEKAMKAAGILTDEDVKFFALIELHWLHDLVDTWQHHTTGLAGSDGQLDWGSIPDQPPPLRKAWVCWQGRVQAEKDLSPGEGEEGDLGASSDDDDENGKLEEQPELEDLTFLTSLDLVLGHED